MEVDDRGAAGEGVGPTTPGVGVPLCELSGAE